ncbi:hypothetical protein CC1G_00498 [Coprinopsis cinerea okayama7|uniref:Secondary metabolism regulator laeA n=1 Tax=Coprinopsis cinerea (strain Okayama-7 / 130 / ATCC MYA-4618 / FGSC 9003) TaxID=240176 RepID=LAEA_COPC7|nr:hypothetical protein CC1G_00498 [Coprinopsis cinerea okayama7\|eukprot:XP_001829319.1 hypothetical protein CC1G_00498 [Coprinopsis cinerea okayama7\
MSLKYYLNDLSDSDSESESECAEGSSPQDEQNGFYDYRSPPDSADTSIFEDTGRSSSERPMSPTEVCSTDFEEKVPFSSELVVIPESMLKKREEYGRFFSNFKKAIYHLPADEEEWDRQERLHQSFIEMFGRKYPPELSEILKSDEYYEKRCLDLGCGTGCWIKEVARDFPYCEAVGVDLVVVPDTRDFPPNLRCEMDDVNLGLQHFFGRFDVVHARLLSSGIKDYQLLIENIARTLRPGGLVELQEYDFHIYDCNRRRFELSTNELAPPWWPRWMTFFNEAIRKMQGDVDAATHLLKWVRTHPGFEQVRYEERWIPIIPGNLDPLEPMYARLQADVSVYLRSGRPLLLKSGLSEMEVDILENNAIREFYESETTQYTRLQCVCARRNNAVLDHLPPSYNFR